MEKLKGMVDYTKALSEGLWVIYGHYLTVHPWSISFCTSLPYSKSVVTWKHLPRLLSEMHKRSILQLVVWLKDEYKSHPNIYFKSGCYEHLRKNYGPFKTMEKKQETSVVSDVLEEPYE
ncbi:hypothetical protein Gohar_007053, partial [Gossypium harknessii]|nr:hypothetical protein [Gossypium harknessii]